MKKVFLIFLLILIIGCPAAVSADELKDGIMIKTIDNTKAIELFKNKLLNDSTMLSRHGFGMNSIVGTPFSMEYQDEENNKYYLFYFPIINDGTIVTYVEQTILDNGTVSWAVTKWFSDESDLEQLRDGTAYALISDKNFNKIAISDNKTVILKADDDYPIDYSTPYINIETKIVDITKPLEEIKTSMLDVLTDEEREIFENAQENQKNVAILNLSDIDIINKNDRILIPIRDLAKFIGCEVNWDASTKTAFVSNNSNIVSFKINSDIYIINGMEHNLDVPAKIINNKTYIPLRAAGEALGLEVAYNAKNQTITLSY